MLYIFIMHGQVACVLKETRNPEEMLLKEGKDYTVEYIPCHFPCKDKHWHLPKLYKPKDWLTPKAYEGKEEEVEF